ncbi:MAG: Asp-tRNA(Asn)/Glu-tRNA(Gln) amidotransferase subunit GatC [Rickettsiales bacterium]|jgi:aspartyl-tRNA(Asn)/glutamyl-tRNA(Gln) amidotransferase subunit C|nr:Asp-tRNA(Asn)/Glu-tRNA(Gln) amidotransferase subunit GatC [Rickettsiales bacterium]
MAFTPAQLQKFAHSIRIEISDQELQDMNIDQVFDWMAQLKKTDTTGIEPMFTPAQNDARMRDDVITVSNLRDAVLANAPDKVGVVHGCFAVPKVIEE